jgi:hypothetical protein
VKQAAGMYVYISHASADEKVAQRVAGALRGAGFRVWDESEILPGDNWGEKLGEALREAEAMVVLLTPASLRAWNVSSEIGYALTQAQYRNRLIPVVAAPPERLPREQIPWVLRKLDVIELPDLDENQEGIDKIVEALQDAALPLA